ncbi:MAG: hypothetical protein NT120_01835 [Candidatus Aenigmarchaeota archaeon]|nr:hypothetical protein [Candidatus Aenigmarchaeota archaeon]
MASSFADRLPSGSLDDFHRFREGRFNFLYLCKTCNRSFDSLEKEDNCKFCGSDIVELRKTNRGRPTTYRHYCPTCERTFTTTEKLTVCNECRTDYLHVYNWNMLGTREKLYIKIRKSLVNVFSNKQGNNTRIIKKLPKMTRPPKEELPTY